jgi:hypothetical protein
MQKTMQQYYSKPIWIIYFVILVYMLIRNYYESLLPGVWENLKIGKLMKVIQPKPFKS